MEVMPEAGTTAQAKVAVAWPGPCFVEEARDTECLRKDRTGSGAKRVRCRRRRKGERGLLPT